mmetsp:Transcript_51108/g.94584  ORF Transcript_51108/g.94584 Transcript_51108/m.94584 type:complete len:409 (+) Transcript_51108:22-1248(+)
MLARDGHAYGLLAILTTVAEQCALAAVQPLSWQTVLPQYENREHLRTRPRTRYSHTATVVGDELLIAFGYFYDRTDGGGATWLSDVWAWRQPELAEPDDDVEPSAWAQVWSAASVGPGPQPRMNHVALALTASTLVIFGGQGMTEASLNDAWKYDVVSGAWQQLGAGAELKPPPRACFSAALMTDPATSEATMVVYGGFHLGDTWAFNFTQESWRLLTQELADARAHPGVRAAHSAVAVQGGSVMYIYGGFRFQEDVASDSPQAFGKLDDLWKFSLVGNRWQEVSQAQHLGGRIFFAMLLLPGESQDQPVLAIHGGSHCAPTCSLDGSLLVAPLDAADHNASGQVTWSKVEVESEPRGRYHHTVTYHQGALWLMGGESYDPIIYYNSVLRLPWHASKHSQGPAKHPEL